MNRREQRRRAEVFRGLHEAPPILVLPNAWDVVSARIFELEGFKAIGTTSAGIAATLGYPDGQQMSLQETAAVVLRIKRCLRVPLSADIEAGYSETPEGVVEAMRAVLDAGAVGVNLKDSACDGVGPLHDEDLQCEKIAAMRGAATSEGIPLVINARTDVYLLPDGDPAERLRHAIRRGNTYKNAGADCVFVPDAGDLNREPIASLVREIDAPLNVIMGPQTPPIGELEEIGVARVSIGPRPLRALLALLRRIARELRDSGTCTARSTESLTYAEVNALFDARAGGRHR